MNTRLLPRRGKTSGVGNRWTANNVTILRSMIYYNKNFDERSLNVPHNDIMTARTLASDYDGAWADGAAATRYWAGVLSELNLLLVYEVPTPCRTIPARLLHCSKWRPTTTVGGARTAVGVRLEFKGFTIEMGNKMRRSQQTTGAHHASHSHCLQYLQRVVNVEHRWLGPCPETKRHQALPVLALRNGFRINNRLHVERQLLLGGIDVRMPWDRDNPRAPQFSINTKYKTRQIILRAA